MQFIASSVILVDLLVLVLIKCPEGSTLQMMLQTQNMADMELVDPDLMIPIKQVLVFFLTRRMRRNTNEERESGHERWTGGESDALTASDRLSVAWAEFFI